MASTSSSSRPLILLFLLSLSVFVSSQQTSNDPLWISCGSPGNYTGNSIYSSNLKTLLLSLRSDDKIDYGFYNFTQGNSTDQVNAIALCRGDVSTSDCRSCLNVSSYDLLQSCPNQKEAAIWYENCMLRYSNETIFRSPKSDVVFYMVNTANATNITLFYQTFNQLLFKLSDEAASGDSTKKFAEGQASPMDFEKLYALVQCTPDISQLDCGNCLNNAFGIIKTYMDGKKGGRALGKSCNFRYETYQFDATPSPPPPTSPTPPPPPVASATPTNSSTPTTTGSNGNQTRTIIIAAVSSVIGLIILISISSIFVLKLRKPKQKDRGLK